MSIKFREFWTNNKASLVPVFGISMLVVMTTTGAAIDMARSYNDNTKAQNALDAAVMALASNITNQNSNKLYTSQSKDNSTNSNLFNTSNSLNEIVKYGEEFFQSNYDNPGGEPVEVQFDIKQVADTGYEVSGKAKGHTKTTFMKLAQKETIDWEPKASAMIEVPAIEMALALGISSTMNDHDFNSMKDGVVGLIEKLYPDLKLNSNRRLSIIPFAESVHLGQNYLRWLHPQYGMKTDFRGCFRPQFDSQTKTIGHEPLLPGYYQALASNERAGVPLCPVQQSEAMFFKYNPNMLKNRVRNLRRGFGKGTGIGLIWAWRALSPSWYRMFYEAADYPKPFGPNRDKYLIVLTDGRAINYDPEGDGVNNGITSLKERESIARQSFLDVCNSIKAEDKMHLYTIGYKLGAKDEAVADDLAKCTSGKGKFFRADDDTLKSIFQTIVKDIIRVRMSG